MYDIYQINPGDTIETIALEYSVSPEYLKNLNGINNNFMLMPGGYIVVPKREQNLFNVYKVIRGDNLYDIARRNNTTQKTLQLLNGLRENDYIYPNQEILIPRDNVNVYATEPEDTLNSVAIKLGVSPTEIVYQNETIYLTPEQILIYKKEKNQ